MAIRRLSVRGRTLVAPKSGSVLLDRLRTDPKFRSAFARPSLESLVDDAMMRIRLAKTRAIGKTPLEPPSLTTKTASAVSRAAARQRRTAPLTRFALRVDRYLTEQLIVPAGRVFMSTEQLLVSCGYKTR